MKSSGIGRPSTAPGISLFRGLVIRFSIMALGACAAIGLLTYYTLARQQRTAAFAQLEALRDEKVTGIDDWVAEKRCDLESAAAEDEVASACLAVVAGQPVDRERTLAQLLRLRDTYGYLAVFVTDNRGHTLVTTEDRDADGLHLPVRGDLVQKALATARTAFSDVFLSKLHRKPTLLMVCPLMLSPSKEAIGVLGILVNVEAMLYPRFTQSQYLGLTGEILLVNANGLVQSPLRYHPDAIATRVIVAEPARRGAAGQTGRVAVSDYRGTPVMAAYGHIRALGWGIVVKQDMAEINVLVRTMARDIGMVCGGVLALAILSGFLMARRIARPAAHIAGVAEQIALGDMNVRARPAGPAEIRRIADTLNRMVDRLARQAWESRTLSDLYAEAGRHGRLDELLDAILAKLMQATRSQSAVVYVASRDAGVLERARAQGLPADRLPERLSLQPPNHLLASVAAAGTVQTCTDIPPENGLVLATQAGESQPRALLSIPLVQRGKAIGVIGLASLYDYREQDVEVARVLSLNLGQALDVTLATEKTERLAAVVKERNQELTTANEELRSKSEELGQQADELRQLTVELQAQRTQIEEADRLKSEFLSNMSHELRTPLNSVLALSELLLVEGTGKDPVRERKHLEIVQRNGRNLLALINDILDLSKIEAGKMELLLSDFEPAAVARTAVETIEPLARERGLDIKVEIGATASMYSDRDKVSQVLLNLLSNAQKFTEHGEIGLRVEPCAAGVRFEVWDTGIGIPAAELPHVFDRFRQVDGSLSRRHGGTGLGLAICQRLARLLGGEITAESTEGRGSTFALVLPLRIPHAQGAEAAGVAVAELAVTSPQPAAQPPATAHPVVLVVEDNDVAVLQIRSALEAAGYTIDVATNGAEAIEKVKARVPHGVVLDLMMPTLDGFQTIEILRATEATANLPVLVLTAKALTAADRRCLSRNNVHELIHKGSVDRNSLVASVDRLVGRTRAEKRRPPAAHPAGAGQSSPAAAAPRPQPPGTATRTAARRPRLLIVEDSPDNLTTARAILDNLGADILEAVDGHQAVATASRERPDLILMDIQLPGLSGLEAARQLRALPETRGIPLVAMTAKAMKGDREQALAAGFDDYLAKPLSPDDLRGMVRKWLPGIENA